MMTVSKEILMHPDFLNGFSEELIEELEALIDAEFEKGDETDFDFIDECAEAINALRSGNRAEILPLISKKDFMKKLGISEQKKIGFAVAACAAVAVLFAAGTQIEVRENVTYAKALSGIVSEFFGKIVYGEKTTQPEITQYGDDGLEEAEIVGITVQTTEEFKAEYTVGESFSDKGIRVFADYSNGERKLLSTKGFVFCVPDSFASEAGYETVYVRAGGFEEKLEVRIIDGIRTPKLSSVYALFPEDFSFTAKDLKKISLDGMRVFAVWSDKTERELSESEYEITVETERTLFEQYSQITVSYGGCSCSFRIMKE